MHEDDLLKYQLALTMVPKVGGITAKKLIAYCGGVEGVFLEKKKTLMKIPGIGANIAAAVSDREIFSRVEKEMEFIKKNGIVTLFYTDVNYPGRLKHCDDGPILLFYKGTANLNKQKIIAVVGTRSITEYGKQKCKEIVEGVKKFDPLILSGLAYGVDARAHKIALDNTLQTVGVLGHGLDRIYPPLNKPLAERMLDNNGGLLSDFVSNTIPDRENFPKRNRIIAGMADALIVVEAAKTGGALITANIANTYNRDVFAVPGRTSDLYSQGCNFLIKTHKAHLAETAKDIEYVMGWEEENQKSKKHQQQQLFVELDEQEKIIADILKENETCSFDFLVQKTGLGFSKTSSLLLNLEFKGAIANLPGKMFKLLISV
ncbi:MAG: DNA-protecting protein DprA [Bacteroidetes bacterium]|nr:MAG: DNA-protecting protein DprA [Bacteroidota bacterium]